MDFKTVTPHFHQAAIATVFTLSIISPVTSWAEDCSTPANPFVVNIATESDDACDDQISLREAITYANNNAGKDAITFADSLNGQTIDATQAAIAITESVSITGPTSDDNGENAELITLKASDSNPLFDITSTTDRIDFNLSNAILEKAGGDNHIIEMDGYGGDIVIDNVQTTEVTQAGGIFRGNLNENEQESEQGNNLSLTLKNSTISGSTFSQTIIYVDSEYSDNEIDIAIENNTISPASSSTGSLVTGISQNDCTVSIHKSNIDGMNLGGKGTLIRSSSDANSSVVISDSSIKNVTAFALALTYSASDSEENNTSLKVDRSTISGNTVFVIGASYSNGVPANIDMSETTISGNTTSYESLLAFGGDGAITIEGSTLCDNLDSSDYQHGLIYADSSSLSISNSKICNNQHHAIKIEPSSDSNSTATIKNTIIENNNSKEKGAGILANVRSGSTLDLNIINSSISGNKSQGHGGGISIEASDESEVNLNISNSTISNNQAGYELTGEDVLIGTGGGIYANQDSGSTLSVDISNTTISENVSAGLGGGIAGYSASNIQIQNSIVFNNVSKNETDQDLFGNFTIHNSLIGELTTNAIVQEGGQLLASTINGTQIDNIGNDEGQIPDTGNNILNQDPLLQELKLSGGTWVHQLHVDSPAIAAGNADIEDLSEFDQRGEGFARVRDVDGISELDMGAVQYFAAPVAVNDAISVEQDSENNSITVLENDAQNSDGLALDEGSVTIMTHPENGDAEALADGSITYTPNAEFFGTDSLVYIVQDIDGNTSSEATVNITVTEEVIADERSDSDATGGSGGGALHFWLLSFFGLLGLRRKQKTTD